MGGLQVLVMTRLRHDRRCGWLRQEKRGSRAGEAGVAQAKLPSAPIGQSEPFVPITGL